MNSLFLIFCTLVIYFFGYRYFAKFLLKTIFRVEPRAPAAMTPATSIVERFRNAPSGQHEMLGFHFAAIAGVSTISGASIAIFWGWVPAYLWLLVGSAVAAGTFAIGSLWLRRQHMQSSNDTGAGTGLIPALTASLPKQLSLSILVLVLVAIIVLAALFTYLTAVLLASFPSVGWPLLVTLAMVGILSRVIANQPATLGSRLPTYLIVTSIILLSIWVTSGSTLGFSGSLNLDLSGRSLLSIDGITIWGILILLLTVFIQRQPFEDWQKNLGVISAMLTVLLLLLFYIGIAIDHPVMSAPAFTKPSSPGLIPWLFITLTSGAYAGFQFFIAYSVTAPKMGHDQSITYVGYGAALLEGLLALSVILVFGATLGNREIWMTLYQSWAALPDGSVMLGHYVNGVVSTLSHLAIGSDYSETVSALVLICLTLVTTISLSRLLRVFLQELGVRFRVDQLRTVKAGSWAGFALLLLAVFLIGSMHSVKAVEQLLGPSQYLLASIGLLFILRELATRNLPANLIRGLSGITVTISVLGYTVLLMSWYRNFELLRFSVGVVLLLLQLSLAVYVAITLWQKKNSPSAPPPPTTPEV